VIVHVDVVVDGDGEVEVNTLASTWTTGPPAMAIV